MDAKKLHMCKHCKKHFSKRSNLKRHIETIHNARNNSDITAKYICHLCSRTYQYKSTLDRHLKTCRSDKYDRLIPRVMQCCLCKASELTKSEMLEHYSKDHDVDVSTTKLKFSSFSKFEEWKEQIETNTISRYVKVSINKLKKRLIQIYRCHRDGYYRSRSKNIRQVKRLGSNKINGHCPSKIYTSMVIQTGEVYVSYLPTHVGHTMDLGRIRLKRSDREHIASQIKQKIPFDDILRNIRDNLDENNFDRLHLLTKHDLFNIEQAYNLGNESVRHCNKDSLSNGINRESSFVRYFKKQGESDDELEDNDYLLIIMNDAQLNFLKKHGNKCIYVNTSSHDFQLTTLMVLDELNQEFPCMFAFSNRSDVEIYKIVFNILRNILDEKLSPDIFISGLSDDFYTAWCEEMGPVDTRLLSSWDVKEDWKKSALSKVKDVDKRKALFKSLRCMLEETDADIFEELLEKCLADLQNDPEFTTFRRYFIDNYLDNTEAWASCYRHHTGLNSKMYNEQAECNIYSKTKSTNTLEEAIDTVMRIARDKLHERLIVLHKGKIFKPLKDLRQRHKSAITSLSDDTLEIFLEQDGTYSMSFGDTEQYKIEILKEHCECSLRCTDCNACIHSYTCSCIDSCIKWNMCVHIHLLCLNLKGGSSSEDRGSRFAEDEVERKQKEAAILSQLARKTGDIEERKGKILEEFRSYLNSATSSEHCKVLENALLTIGPAFEAISSTIDIKNEDSKEEVIVLEKIDISCPSLVFFKKE
ncbi:unnamed protein product [Phyllotreta striolata]|uniref:C2H2-type domain-containing protein n=1 Tax=Phyllotreta striolata TaxID=444603 RepID=A0A9N9TNI7_PHYSR|nr:unnamed protein product [Phyllotreta striolata]